MLRFGHLLLILGWFQISHLSAQAPIPVDAFGDETYAFSGGDGKWRTEAYAWTGSRTLEWEARYQIRNKASNSLLQDVHLGVFSGNQTVTVEVPVLERSDVLFTVQVLWKYTQNSEWNFSMTAYDAVGSSVDEFTGESQLSYMVKNATGEPVGFTWELSVPAEGGTWVNGSQASTAGRTMGSTVYDLADGASVVLNGPDNRIAYEWKMKPAEGTGENTVSLPGELTVMMQGEYGHTYVFDITRVFNMTVSTGSEGPSGSGPFPQGPYEFEVTLSPGPVITSLTLAYQLRNSTNEAQPLRLFADGQMWDFGTVPPTAAGATVVPLSQQVNVLQSLLAGKAWEVKLGNRVVGNGTFGVTGPFVATVTGEVGGAKDGYEFLDGHWVPRGGGENPTLPPADGSSEDPTPPETPDDKSKPGESVPAMAKAVTEGVGEALKRMEIPDVGGVDMTGAAGVTGQGIPSSMVVTYAPGSVTIGAGQATGFTFTLFGRTYSFDWADSPLASYVPSIREFLKWIMYLFVGMAGIRMLVWLASPNVSAK